MIKKLVILFFLICSNSASSSCRESIPATTPSDNFIFSDISDVVIDKRTGLMWKRCIQGFSGSDCLSGSESNGTYSTVLNSIDTLNENGGFAGYDDWRLPNLKELRSIVEERCHALALNEEVFPYNDVDSKENDLRLHWASTPRPYRESQATWVIGIDFFDGASVRFSVGSSNTDSSSIGGVYRLVRNAH